MVAGPERAIELSRRESQAVGAWRSIHAANVSMKTLTRLRMRSSVSVPLSSNSFAAFPIDISGCCMAGISRNTNDCRARTCRTRASRRGPHPPRGYDPERAPRRRQFRLEVIVVEQLADFNNVQFQRSGGHPRRRFCSFSWRSPAGGSFTKMGYDQGRCPALPRSWSRCWWRSRRFSVRRACCVAIMTSRVIARRAHARRMRRVTNPRPRRVRRWLPSTAHVTSFLSPRPRSVPPMPARRCAPSLRPLTLLRMVQASRSRR
jgi:hypothetical protein